MKFIQLEPFQKQFTQSFPQHLSPVYLLTMIEHRSVVEWMLAFLQKEENYDILQTESVDAALSHLRTVSLFGATPVAIFAGDPALFAGYVENPQTKAVLILAAEKASELLYKKGKKEMVWLDLKGEKPWEKKERLQRFIASALNGRRFSTDVVHSLLSRTGGDTLLIQREIEKLFVYVGDKPEITLTDLDAIGLPFPEQEGFALAEKIVFNRGRKAPAILSDLSQLLALIGPLRYVFEQSLCITTAHTSPPMAPRMLEKYRKNIGSLPPSYFARGLKALFHLELSAKSSAASPQILYDRFRSSL